MIDAGTVLGLAELESARETQDFREGGDFQPDLRAGVAVNPDSELIPVTRANGVTAVVTRPTGGVVAGQGALINLAGWTPREMTVVDLLALFVEFPAARDSPSATATTGVHGPRAGEEAARGEGPSAQRSVFAGAVYERVVRTGPTLRPIHGSNRWRHMPAAKSRW